MEEQNKHRDWLKSHEGLRFLRNAEQGNTNRKWELNYSDENYDSSINLIDISPELFVIPVILSKMTSLPPNKLIL